MFKLKTHGKEFEVKFRIDIYRRSRARAVELYDNEGPFTTVSVHLPESAMLDDEEVFFMKHWSENEAVAAQLLELGMVEPVPEIPATRSGYVKNIRAYRLTPKALEHVMGKRR